MILPSAARRAGFRAAAFFLARLFASALAQDNFCGTHDQRSAIINDRLYFTSGNYSFDDGRLRRLEPFMYSLDLLKPFNASGLVKVSSLSPTQLPDSTLQGRAGPRFGGYGGVFFHDNSTLYPYAAMTGIVSQTDLLWRYHTTEKRWTQVKIEGAPLALPDNYAGVFAHDPTTSRSFYTGGYRISFNGINQGVVRFDLSNPIRPKWDFLPQDRAQISLAILKGGMVYIPKGKAGMLVAFGGWDVSYGDEPLVIRPLNQIFVFDIHLNKWYIVEADGEIPDWRYEFCTVTSAAPDSSSFQITIYAGLDLGKNRRFGEVYTLSIPSFTWINVTPPPSNDPELLQASKFGRIRHTCEVFRGRQMIVVGGEIDHPKCNKEFPPFRVFDTVKYEWRTQFDPNLGDYEVPERVYRIIGGNAFGNATRRQPRNGWDTQLNASFAETHELAENHKLTNLPSNATSNAISNRKVIGGAVGGLFGLAAIVLAVYIFINRHYKRAQPLDPEETFKPEKEFEY